MDLLGRRAVARGGEPLRALAAEVAATAVRARAAGVDEAWVAAVERGVNLILSLTFELAQHGLRGDVDAMMRHACDYMDLASTVVVAWQWIELAAAAREGLARGAGPREGFYTAKLAAAQYWIATELPRIDHLAQLCRSGEDSYAKLDPDTL
jgi:butyryl-CoA dehydrogenase